MFGRTEFIILFVFAALWAVFIGALFHIGVDEGYPGPHTCEEDEAQYVTPDGLACTPLDNLNRKE